MPHVVSVKFGYIAANFKIILGENEDETNQIRGWNNFSVRPRSSDEFLWMENSIFE